MRHFSEEAKERMRIAHTGKHLSEEHKRNIGIASLGKKYPGRHLSEGHKEKLRDAFTGRYVSEETKRKMSEAQKGKRHSEETKKKLSDFFKGKPLSDETKRKMSTAHKGKSNWTEENKLFKEKNPAWNGGSSFQPYSSEFTDELKRFIKDRDNNECQNPYCDHRVEILNIHHIDYNKENSNQFNLITLCSPCNVKANGNRKEWRRFYKRIIWSKYG